ncbi:hypothetical protein [uncultured Tistrella sp.]|uniref:hypothetical protein n=1 Tax=Tistrella mobilis TaxID=171437 RepID=UPI000C09AA2E|nr:hypothetical protein [uncultured Tistrella sp.]MAM76413.1 hypothetical protein [Tistrella sp.]
MGIRSTLAAGLIAGLAWSVPASASSGTASAPFDPAMVHPACFDSLVSQAYTGETALERLPLAGCPGSEIAPEPRQDMMVMVRPPAEPEGNNPGGWSRGWVGSRLVGRFDGDRLVYELVENGGGTGVFSMLLSGRLAAAEGVPVLEDLVLAPAGDRCNGGIHTATRVDGRALDVAQWATPYDLVSLILGLAPDDAPDGVPAALGKAAEELPFCAACCAGTVLLRLDAATLAPHGGAADAPPLPGEVVTVTADGLGEYDDPASRCLARTLIPEGATDPQAELSLPLERLPGLKAALLSCTTGKSHKK